MDRLRLLAISGSLRQVSKNSALLTAGALVAPPTIEIVPYTGLGDLPHFNPDVEGPDEPPPIVALRAAVRAADGLLVSSPEYAHGVPGALKNALDWLVSGEEFVGKPVALWNPSPRATYAQASLAETITVMSGRLVASAAVVVPLTGRPLTAEEIVAEPERADALRQALAAFARAIAEGPAPDAASDG